jgi:phospholipid/cholesterol/gamma-HCH transport system ATP-binding protein
LSEEPIISVRGLVTRFGTKTVHNGLDLDVRRGEIIGIIGPSGEGKSVLLNAIVGLVRPAAGEVRLFGIDRTTLKYDDERLLDSRVGVMFQDGALFSTLTVRENIEAPMKEHVNLPAALRYELAEVKLLMAGLPADAANKYPSELSGGLRKRAALARALALDPELLFLDEPTAGLDPVAAGRFDELVVRLRDTLGLTIFLVTHDLDTLHAVADRVAIILHGKIAAIGPLEQVRRGATGWVADYFSGPRGRAALGPQT